MPNDMERGGSLNQHGRKKERICELTAANKTDAIIINEVQLVLAEKRTSLAVMRTGIAVLILPLSVISLLVATSKYYDVFSVIQYLIFLGLISFILIILGAYLIIKSIFQMRRYDRLVREIKIKHSVIGKFIS